MWWLCHIQAVCCPVQITVMAHFVFAECHNINHDIRDISQHEAFSAAAGCWQHPNKAYHLVVTLVSDSLLTVPVMVVAAAADHPTLGTAMSSSSGGVRGCVSCHGCLTQVHNAHQAGAYTSLTSSLGHKAEPRKSITCLLHTEVHACNPAAASSDIQWLLF